MSTDLRTAFWASTVAITFGVLTEAVNHFAHLDRWWLHFITGMTIGGGTCNLIIFKILAP